MIKDKIIQISKNVPEPPIIARASQILLSGGVVVYPSDTVYSLAANALDDRAVAKIFKIKGREKGKPIHVLVRDMAMIRELVEVTKMAENLIQKFYPGFLNIVLKSRGRVSPLLTAGTGTLGVRIPNFEVTRQLALQSNLPYTGTSANPSGGQSPHSLSQLFSQFSAESLALIDLILDAGDLPPVSPSTVLDLSQDPPKMVRDGPVSRQELEEFLGMTIL